MPQAVPLPPPRDDNAHEAAFRRAGSWSFVVSRRSTVLGVTTLSLLGTLFWEIGHAESPMGVSLAVAGIVGLGAGLALAFYQDRREDPVHSYDDVTRELGAPLLGTVPEAALTPSPPTPVLADVPVLERSENRLEFISYRQERSPVAAAYRSAVRGLVREAGGRAHQVILVTSAAPSEGKTTTSINMAIALAETGRPTLLVSTDFRRPRTDELFEARALGGLSGVVAGEVGLADEIVPTGIPNFSLLPCGRMPRKPVETLLSDGFAETLDRLRADYSYVVFDSPPVGKVAEALALARRVDYTVLVVRMGRTSRRLARQVLDRLRAEGPARSTGVVLNGCGELAVCDEVDSEPPLARTAAGR